MRWDMWCRSHVLHTTVQPFCMTCELRGRWGAAQQSSLHLRSCSIAGSCSGVLAPLSRGWGEERLSKRFLTPLCIIRSVGLNVFQWKQSDWNAIELLRQESGRKDGSKWFGTTIQNSDIDNVMMSWWFHINWTIGRIGRDIRRWSLKQ